jgi:hypothetical protein
MVYCVGNWVISYSSQFEDENESILISIDEYYGESFMLFWTLKTSSIDSE